MNSENVTDGFLCIVIFLSSESFGILVVMVVSKYVIWLIMTPANCRDLEAWDVIVFVLLMYIVISQWNSVVIIIEIFALQKFHWLNSFTVVK